MNKKIYIYDLECYHQLFSATFIDRDSDECRVFYIYKDVDQRNELISFLRTEVAALVGFNCLSYDSQLLEFLFRNPGATTFELRNYSDLIVNTEDRRVDVPEWRLSIPHLDLYKIHHFDNKNRRTGLKWCEFMMDLENIEDLPSDGVGDNWLDMTLAYNLNDVIATKELYNRSKKLIELRSELSAMYGLNFRNASNSKIGSELALHLYCKATGKFKNDVRAMRTVRNEVVVKDIIFPYINFKSNEFNNVLKRFNDTVVVNTKGDIEFSVTYKHFQFDYGAGGIHGSLHNAKVEANDEYMIIDADVASLYPSIAIVNKLYPEHLGEEFYQVYEKDIVAVRLAEKAKKDNGNKAIVEGFKEAANSVYGKSNDQYSWLQDMKYTMATTINGQLMLSMLAESLMEIENLQMIQINTDGLTVKIPRNKEKEYYNICRQWESLTKLTLEYVEYSKMILFDVNNYIGIYTNSNKKPKCKGRCEFENIPLHKNKSHAIIPKAFHDYFVHNTPIETTIKNHTNIFDFCAGVKASSSPAKGKSWYELHSVDNSGIKKEKLSKTVRYFISKKGKWLFKCYSDGSQSHVEAPLNLGKMKKDWKVTYFNKSWKCDNFKDYDVCYEYYIHHSKEWVNQIEGDKYQLELF